MKSVLVAVVVTCLLYGNVESHMFVPCEDDADCVTEGGTCTVVSELRGRQLKVCQCAADTDCDTGEVCHTKTARNNDTISICRQERNSRCASDADCPTLNCFKITSTDTEGVCGGCQNDTDCSGGDVCAIANRCDYGTCAACASDEDCATDEICDLEFRPRFCRNYPGEGRRRGGGRRRGRPGRPNRRTNRRNNRRTNRRNNRNKRDAGFRGFRGFFRRGFNHAFACIVDQTPTV